MDPKTMPNRRCKCEDKSHEKCPVVHGTDHCTVHLGSIISQSIEKVTFYSYFDQSISAGRLFFLHKQGNFDHLIRKKIPCNVGINSRVDSRSEFQVEHGFTFFTFLPMNREPTKIGHNFRKQNSLTIKLVKKCQLLSQF